MAKKKNQAPKAAAKAGSFGHPRFTGWRGTVAGLAVAIVAPPLLLLVVELALHFCGYGYSTRFFATSEDGRTLTTNRRFGWQFMPRESAVQPYPVTMAIEKPPGTRRIFIVGESAAQGTPAPGFGFGRILEVMLQAQFPGERFEIVNAAMRGINSHAVRPIVRECAAHDPDLFIVFMGNNEAVGFYAPEPGRFNLTAYPRLIRFAQWLKSTKSAQLFDSIIQGRRKESSAREKQDMEFFRKHLLAADHRLREAVLSNFRRNFDDIASAGRESGAKVLICTVPVNLLDFPPLGSVHRAGLSANELSRWDAAYKSGVAAETKGDLASGIQSYEQAARTDDRFAELRFRLGRCLLANGEVEKARPHFEAARDWDALPFRTDGRMNDAVRHLAKSVGDGSVRLAEVEGAFSVAATNEHNIPGHRFFHEHVHFNFEGDYLVARTLLPEVVAALGLNAGAASTIPSRRPIQSREECAAALGFSPWDEIGTQAALVRMTANPPFLDQLEHGARQARAEADIAQRTRAFSDPAMQQQAVDFCRTAVARRPDDWQIQLALGNLLLDFGRFAEAVEPLSLVVKAQPGFLQARMLLGHSLRQAGRPAEAVAQLEEVLKRDPGNAAAKNSN